MRHWIGLIAIGGAVLANSALAQDRPGLFLQAGESVIFALENGQPTKPRAAGGAEPAEGEIKAEMTVTNGQTLLVVKNGGPQALNYRASITPKATSRGDRTSVCTLLPGVPMFESWPGRLPGLRISDFEPAENGQMICR
jgi:hypothetical protein